MCGITGVLDFNSSIEADVIASMTQTIKHRGPDASGISTHWGGKCFLGHRRLSIIDLSDTANQPMLSSCGQFTIVYNGEVYNFEEIKSDLLKEKEINFQTGSDTEVILEAFIHWGVDFVQRLNGMFAIAIVDELNHQVYLFRDRIGIKPLYYIKKGSAFAFASELKALTPLVDVWGEFTLSNEAIQSYFRLGYVPEPLSIYKEVNKFPAGSWARIDERGCEITSYWQLEDCIQSTVIDDELDAKHELTDLLLSSVKYRLKSHVPFGVFLSGGIDSSLVAALAQKQAKKPIQTFSIAFSENTYDESKYAKAVAEHIGSQHHEFTVTYKEAQDLVKELHSFYDEPFGDASAIPTYLVSKLAGKEVKMVLTGDGGDEQFLGYGMYTWANRLNHPVVKISRPLIYQLIKNSGINRFKRAAELFNHPVNSKLKEHIFSVEQYLFTEKESHQLLTRKQKLKTISLTLPLKRVLTPQEEQAFFDLKMYLKDDLLVKVDRASMRASIEARVPLLDHRIVEFSLNIDEGLKVRNGDQKYLLKQVLFDYVPKSLFERPKWGFGLPIRNWLANELKPVLDEYLDPTALKEVGLFEVEEVMRIKKRYLDGEDYLYNKLWLILLFVQWYKNNAAYFKN